MWPQVAVVLDAPFFMLSHVPRNVAVPVMTNLLFAPSLRALADEALRAVKDKTGSESFNGLHLRVEDDAAAYVDKVCVCVRWRSQTILLHCRYCHKTLLLTERVKIQATPVYTYMCM